MIIKRALSAAGLAVFAAFAHPAFAQGAVYRCIDENGRPQYTNVKTDTEGKKCTVVTREVSVVPPAAPTPAPRAGTAQPPAAPGAANPAAPSAPPNAASANFPRVDRDTQRSRDDSRRKILEDELAQEERSLFRARQDLNEQTSAAQRAAATPGAGGTGLDRLRPLQDAVDRHERNIAAIRKELSNIR
jgi:hypothetical protein